MSVEQDISDLQQLIATAKDSLKLLKKRKKRQDDGKSHADMTPKMWGNRNADIAWDNMQLEKNLCQMHATAVDIGIAKLENEDHYEAVIFRPSSMQQYKFVKPLPRCVQGLKNKNQ